MFDYLIEKRKFTIKLGQFISHKIVRPYNISDGRMMATVKELNQMDRFDLARKAISIMPKHYLSGDYEISKLIKDTAVYIDQRIHLSFAKWTELDHSKGPAQMKINADDYGLIYHFNQTLF